MQLLIDILLTLVYLGIVALFVAWFWHFLVLWANQRHLDSINWVMLEIKLPREIDKSPLAMELILPSFLIGSGLDAWYKRYIVGNLPQFSSLEIASLEGEIHFYVRVRRSMAQWVQSSFYAQYPGIEIAEVDDYVSMIRYHHLSEDVDTWSGTYRLTKKWTPTDSDGKPFKEDGEVMQMPADYLPMSTYIDLGLDKDPKEQYKNDPLVTMIEAMGAIGKGEYLWYQIIVEDETVFNAKYAGEYGKKFPKMYVMPDHRHINLVEMAEERKKQLRKYREIKKGSLAYDAYGNPIQKTDKDKNLQPVTYAEDVVVQAKENELATEAKDEIELINRKLSKQLIRCVIRQVYVAKKENFNPQNITNILNYSKIFNRFNSNAPYMNSLGTNSSADPYSYPWENFMNRRVPWRKEEIFEAYVEREGLHPHMHTDKNLDWWEDKLFWHYSMKLRKVWRMTFEGFVKPFAHPEADDAFILNTEELATLWHLPGSIAQVPTLSRIDSTKSVAPLNLPQ